VGQLAALAQSVHRGVADAELLGDLGDPEQGYDVHLRATEMSVGEDVSIDDIDQSNVRPNMGPMIVRGVWYPCLNIGFGGPRRL
jgi:hypothetical protein